MSPRTIPTCSCNCSTNGHPGTVCTGDVGGSLPARSNRAGFAEQPVCRACRDTITAGWTGGGSPTVVVKDTGPVVNP